MDTDFSLANLRANQKSKINKNFEGILVILHPALLIWPLRCFSCSYAAYSLGVNFDILE